MAILITICFFGIVGFILFKKFVDRETVKKMTSLFWVFIIALIFLILLAISGKW